jgi:gliding motility-associated-like protein
LLRKLCSSIAIVLICIPNLVKSQNSTFAQLNGTPLNTSGWNLIGAAKVTNVTGSGNGELLLSPNQANTSGGIFFSQPINISQCAQWTAEFDYRIFDGTGGEGLAFCYLDAIPTSLPNGSTLGIPSNANGLKICIDPHNDCDNLLTPKLEVKWGVGYSECSAFGSTVSNIRNILSSARSNGYVHIKVTYASGKIRIFFGASAFEPFGSNGVAPAPMNFNGYFGFVASTGSLTDNESVKNVVITSQSPPSNAGTKGTICPGQPLQIGGANNASYVYSWLPSTGLNNTTISNPVASPDNTTGALLPITYYVKTAYATSPGCTSVDSVVVSVKPKPLIDFTVPVICMPSGKAAIQNNTVINDGTQSQITYSWTFGDGGSSTQTNPVYTYKNTGTYTIDLKAAASDGCTNDFSKTVTINPQAKATLNTLAEYCQDSSLNFTGSINSTLSVQKWHWSFGDNTTDSVQNPVHKFATPQTYTVNLYATTTDGCNSDTAKASVVIDALPVANFTSSGLACANQAFTFTDQSTPIIGSLSGWNWIFDDSTYAATQNASHSFLTPGTHAVGLIVKNSKNCLSKELIKNIVINPTPVASFATSSTGCSNTTTIFSDSTTISAGGNLATAVYTWTFGDNGTSSLHSPTHAYATPGTYPVKLSVNYNGCIDDTTETIVIASQPKISITALNEYCQDSTMLFGGTINGYTVKNWNWSFGDNTTDTLQNTQHKYATAKTYTVSLYAITTAGCSSDTAKVNVLVDPLPVANFTSVGLACANQAFTFTDQSTSTAGTITGWKWLFDDSTSAISQTASHAFATDGTHPVTLTVQSSKNCLSKAVVKNVVINPTPVANFATSAARCINTATAFTDSSTISTGNSLSNAGYTWSFGDNSSSTQKSPSHTYTSSGTYSVKLSVNYNGCIDDTIKTVTIAAQPKAGINALSEYCQDSTLSLAGTVSAGNTAQTWRWDFGDNTTDTVQNTTHKYSTAKSYSVSLYAVTTNGCNTDTVKTTVLIDPLPVADFSFAGLACANQVINLTDQSTTQNASVTGWSWLFDDSTKAGTKTTTHQFATDGVHPVQLQVQNSKGCISKAVVKNVTINPTPVVNFTAPPVCLNTQSSFINTSTISDHSENTFIYQWTFGDGGVASQQNPTHLYSNTGNYDVQLIVTSGNGCKDSATNQITVSNFPTVNFSVLNNNDCSNTPLQIQDQSSVAGGTISALTIVWNNPGKDSSSYSNPAANTTYNHTYTSFGSPATQQVNILVRAYSSGGCSAYKTTAVTLLASPSLSFNKLPVYCANISTQQLLNEAKDNSALSGTGFYSGDGVNNDYFTPSVAGAGNHTITYHYTLSNSCTDSISAVMRVGIIPTVSGGPEVDVLQGGEGVLQGSANGGDDFTYLWTPGMALNDNTDLQPTVTPVSDTYYQLKATNGDGCFDTAGVWVRIVKMPVVPNAFSPNGDGINDTWQIQYLNSYPDCDVAVFNRYGQMVFHSVGYKTPWNGTTSGSPLPVGTYYYIITTKLLSKPLSGSITIIR